MDEEAERAMASEVIQIAKNSLLRGEEIVPMLFIRTDEIIDGKNVTYIQPFEVDEERSKTHMDLFQRGIAFGSNAISVAMVNDGYMVHRDKDEINSNVRPIDDPEAKETITYEFKNLEEKFMLFAIYCEYDREPQLEETKFYFNNIDFHFEYKLTRSGLLDYVIAGITARKDIDKEAPESENHQIVQILEKKFQTMAL